MSYRSPSNPRGTHGSYGCNSIPDEKEETENDKDQDLNQLRHFFSDKPTPKDIKNPPPSFKWPLYFALLRQTQADVTELVRKSCETLTGKSKYIDINHQLLEQYANSIDLNEGKRILSPFQVDLHSKANNLSERDIINMSCLFVILHFGSGFTPLLQTYYKGSGSMIGDGIWSIFKKYKSFSVKTLASITIEDLAELFHIGRNQMTCDMIHKCIAKMVLILELKHFTDFADYVYYCLDLSWIKSQTKDLSAITTFEWELNKQSQLGIVFAPTRSKIIRRCVVTDFKPTDDEHHNAVCKDLVQQRTFLYAINDQIVYNKPFEEIISIIRSYVKSTEEDEYKFYTVGGKKMVALQFGMHLDREPETMQTLLFNLVNDFSVLNDQYLYKDFFANNRHLKVYLFQSVQSIVMELYYNVYVTAPKADRNEVFNFSGIQSLTGVVDNVIPFVLLRDKVIKLKDEFQHEFDDYIKSGCLLNTSCDLEIEIIASSIWAMELIVRLRNAKEDKRDDINIAKLVYSLRNKGKMQEYDIYKPHHQRTQ